MHLAKFSTVCLLCINSLYALSDEVEERIKTLVQSNPGQLCFKEYACMANQIENLAPAHILIFGVGHDSSLWMDLNLGGRTVFLEDNSFWLNKIKEKNPGIEAYLVSYGTRRKEWQQLLMKGDFQALRLELPPHLEDVKWDLIFVDGPEGWDDSKPGRMKSIYTAADLAYGFGSTHVFIHDCDRVVEATYCDCFFLEKDLLESFDRMRHYKTP